MFVRTIEIADLQRHLSIQSENHSFLSCWEKSFCHSEHLEYQVMDLPLLCKAVDSLGSLS